MSLVLNLQNTFHDRTAISCVQRHIHTKNTGRFLLFYEYIPSPSKFPSFLQPTVEKIEHFHCFMRLFHHLQISFRAWKGRWTWNITNVSDIKTIMSPFSVNTLYGENCLNCFPIFYRSSTPAEKLILSLMDAFVPPPAWPWSTSLQRPVWSNREEEL